MSNLELLVKKSLFIPKFNEFYFVKILNRPKTERSFKIENKNKNNHKPNPIVLIKTHDFNSLLGHAKYYLLHSI
jgi:hypothetical protein